MSVGWESESLSAAPAGKQREPQSIVTLVRRLAHQLATLLRLTERYCVVYQTLRNAPPIAVRLTNGAG